MPLDTKRSSAIPVSYRRLYFYFASVYFSRRWVSFAVTSDPLIVIFISTEADTSLPLPNLDVTSPRIVVLVVSVSMTRHVPNV